MMSEEKVNSVATPLNIKLPKNPPSSEPKTPKIVVPIKLSKEGLEEVALVITPISIPNASQSSIFIGS